MKHFLIWTLGDRSDKTLAFFRSSPKGLELRDYYLNEGVRLDAHYPSDAQLHMDPRSPGMKLSSLLGNIKSFLIVHTDMKNVIEQTCSNEIEYLPVSIVNHKKRVQSKDYWFVNPIGVVDCVDRAASDIDYRSDDPQQVVGVTKLAFSSAKLVGAPHLFRVPEQPEEFFISATLGKAFLSHEFSNVLLQNVEVT
jgi:hypothetical protein